MSIEARLLHRATELLSKGKRKDAQKVLTAVLRLNPANRTAWRQYQNTSPNPQVFQQLVNVIRQRHTHFKPPFSPLIIKPIFFQSAPRRIGSIILAISALLIIVLLTWSTLTGKQATTYWQTIASTQKTENDSLQQELGSLQTRYQNLSANQDALSQSHTKLQTEYQSLQHVHNILVEENQALQQAYNGLQSDYEISINQLNALQYNFDQLSASHNQLTLDFNNLNESYGYLYAEYENLKAQAIQPPYITVNGRQVYMAFFHSSGEIMYWNIEFEHLEDAIRRGYRARFLGDFFSKVQLDTEQGKTLYAPDFRDFVNPTPFQDVMADLYRRSDSDEQFVYEVWNIVAQLTTYTDESLEIPRYPLETLLAGGGDCEDSAILVASMLEAAPVDWRIDLVYMDGNNPFAPVTPNHVMVYVNTNRRDYWIETTSDSIMEPTRNVKGWYFTIN